MVCAIVRLFSWMISFCSKDPSLKRQRGTRVIIDWHNYGWTILEVNRVNKTFVRCARAFELLFGKFADYHLTVSEAMKEHLSTIAPAIRRKPIHVLYDRATPKFKQTTLQVKHDLYATISLEGQVQKNEDGNLCLCADRDVLLLSSTSYTPDEDFMVLVEALDRVD